MGNEEERLLDLKNYHILDTSPEKELNDIAELASVICDTPISLLSFVDDQRQWFKAVKGLDIRQTPKADAFCQHTLYNPKEVLVVNDPLQDERFMYNPLVMGNPNIRFYAGAPLETPAGNVLGALCVIDNKDRMLSEQQKKALQLLAQRAMDYLNQRKQLINQEKEIDLNTVRLKKLTDLAPGCIFQLEMSPVGDLFFSFMSEGLYKLHPNLNPETLKRNPRIAFAAMHPGDVPLIRNSIKVSFTDLSQWNIEFRVVNSNQDVSWHWINAKPERQSNGNVAWYGLILDITTRKEYEQTLEQISFDISHVLRRPIVSMLGLTSLIESDDMNQAMLKEYARPIKVVSEEMDRLTKKLDTVYSEKMTRFRKN